MRFNVATIGLGVALLGFVSGLVIRTTVLDPYAEQRRELKLEEDVLRSPGRDALLLAAMEHPFGWADLVWLGIVQELGKPVEGIEPSYDRLQRWAHIAVDLDPLYFTVYYASATHLTAWAKRALASDEILRKGRRFIPDRWELPFLMGYNAYFLIGDCDSAAEYWNAAAELPDPPRFVRSLVARSKAQCGSREEAIAYLEAMLTELPEGPHRDDVLVRLKIMKSGPILDAYDAACAAYQSEHEGRLPKDGAEIYRLSNGALPPPQDLLGKDIFFRESEVDGRCRARTEYIKLRDDESAQINLGRGRGAVSPGIDVDVRTPQGDQVEVPQ